jgi:hypothetical protein
MSRRVRFSSRDFSPWMSRPMNTTGPSEEISRSTASASVVLPDPLSPTMPSVSPSRTLTEARVHRLHMPHRAAQKPALDREPDA